MSKTPMISVIMAVYNTKEEYLIQSVHSILSQTFQNFEFIIVNDHSKDETTELLKLFNDPRIILIENAENQGLTKSLNTALKLCKGQFIARMDSDDISWPERFEKQLYYMQQHPEYAVIGSMFERSDHPGYFYPKNWNDDMELRKIHLLFYNDGIAHPTAFFRKKFLDDHHIQYDPDIRKAQDFAMWVNISDNGGNIGLIPDALLTYRISDSQISSGFSDQMRYEQMTLKKQLDRFRLTCSEQEMSLYYHMYRGEISGDESQLVFFLKKIIASNNLINLYPKELFIKEIKHMYFLGSLKQMKKQHRIGMLLNLHLLRIAD